MAMTGAERMARLRERRRGSGKDPFAIGNQRTGVVAFGDRTMRSLAEAELPSGFGRE